MSSHTSTKGAMGEHAVIVALLEQGYEVFKDVTGASEVDLIAYKAGQFKRVQVKTRLSKCGSVRFPRFTGGREIQRQVQGHEFDVMAMYVRDRQICLFMNVEELIQNKTGVSVRLDVAENGAQANIRWYDTYTRM